MNLFVRKKGKPEKGSFLSGRATKRGGQDRTGQVEAPN